MFSSKVQVLSRVHARKICFIANGCPLFGTTISSQRQLMETMNNKSKARHKNHMLRRTEFQDAYNYAKKKVFACGLNAYS